jgi:ubiquinone/menaquinone biosynthesis C-methylase UbiE
MYHYLAYMARRGATNLHPGGAAAYADLAAALALSPGQRVLEVGCGAGATMVRILADWDVDVIGIDIMPDMVAIARRRLLITGLRRRGRVVQAAPGKRLPFSSESFDRVYLEGALGFQNPDASAAMLAEIFRVVRPGGRVVANDAVWKPGVPAHVVASIHAASVRDFGICQASEQNWTVREWCETMARVGFQVEAAEAIQPSWERPREPWRTRFRPRLLISASYSAILRATSIVSSRARSRHRRYRRLLDRHQDDSGFIEGRLFVLRKCTPTVPCTHPPAPVE